jgi:hypothetical protein
MEKTVGRDIAKGKNFHFSPYRSLSFYAPMAAVDRVFV